RYTETLIGPASLLVALCAALGADAAFSTRRRSALFAAQAAALGLTLLALSGLLGSRAASFQTWAVHHGREHIVAVAPVFLQALRQGLQACAALCAPLVLCAGACAASPRLL